MEDENLRAKATIELADGTSFRLFDDKESKKMSGVTKCEIIRPNDKVYHALLDIRRLRVISLKEFKNNREYRIHEKDLDSKKQDALKATIQAVYENALKGEN